MKAKVLIVMGSDSDLPVMERTASVLKEFNIPYKMTVSSAHRTPERTLKLIRSSERDGVQIIIAGAGAAAEPSQCLRVAERCDCVPRIRQPLHALQLHSVPGRAARRVPASSPVRADDLRQPDPRRDRGHQPHAVLL